MGLGGLLGERDGGLDTFIGTGGSKFSGGARARVAVARTLLTRADAILPDEQPALLDEPAAVRMLGDRRWQPAGHTDAERMVATLRR